MYMNTLQKEVYSWVSNVLSKSVLLLLLLVIVLGIFDVVHLDMYDIQS